MSKAIQTTIDFVDLLNAKFAGEHEFSIMPAQRFDKIVIKSIKWGYNGTGAVYAFIERSTSMLVKAAGWAQPQKRPDKSLAYRYDLSTPQGMENAISRADFAGSFLYEHADFGQSYAPVLETAVATPVVSNFATEMPEPTVPAGYEPWEWELLNYSPEMTPEEVAKEKELSIENEAQIAWECFVSTGKFDRMSFKDLFVQGYTARIKHEEQVKALD